MILSTLRVLALLCLAAAVTNAQGGPFGPPIAGEINRDYFIQYLVDHDTAEDESHDAFCGDRTYDDSWGTDFILRSIPQMDSGVAVLAVADGVVLDVVDFYPDRHDSASSWSGNSILIKHEDGYFVYYEHLRRGSIVVEIDDSVRRGEVIAQVGSSGYSVHPQLHFEVWDFGSIVDPFSGPCQTVPSLWRTQPVHDPSFALIDFGMLSWVPTIDTLNWRPPSRTAFFSATDDLVTFWAHMRGIRVGDRERVEFYTPLDELWTVIEFDPSEYDYFFYYLYAYTPLPPIPGTWRVQYVRNNQVELERLFTVDVESSVDAASAIDGAITYDPRAAALTVTLPGSPGPRDLEVALVDITGRTSRTLFTGRVDGSMFRCAIDESLPVGTYVVRVRSEGEPVMSRVVVLGE